MTAYALSRVEDASLRAAIALCAGGILLLARAQVLSLGTARSAALLVIYSALAVLSLRSPAPRARRGHAPAFGVAGAGIAALVAVSFAPWQTGVTFAYGASAAAMGLVAAVAEEAFFRRFMYAWVERWWGSATSVVVTALVFALVHVPLYGVAVLWLDLGAGLLLSWQRWTTGSWAAPAATHATANLLVVIR
jgi:membrane protease YdiL (CAAX protease family)